MSRVAHTEGKPLLPPVPAPSQPEQEGLGGKLENYSCWLNAPNLMGGLAHRDTESSYHYPGHKLSSSGAQGHLCEPPPPIPQLLVSRATLSPEFLEVEKFSRLNRENLVNPGVHENSLPRAWESVPGCP